MNESVKRDLTEFSTILLSELQKLNERVYQNNLELQQTNQEVRSIREGVQGGGQNMEPGGNTYIPPAAGQVPATPFPSAPSTGGIFSNPPSGLPVVKTGGSFLGTNAKTSNITYQGMSGFAGFNLGGNATANIGFRWHYRVGDTKIELMPETFFGFGTPANFGISMNGILPFTLKKTNTIRPYIGAGAGFMQIGESGENRLKGALNIIVGSYINVAGGRVFVDLTGRNLFKNNQLIAGYRFAF